jgi:VIT1/CCC1 family predicted Fe2+/Mn2+ transporter
MKKSYIKGISFGLTSGIITTLGMMIGLYTGTNSTLAVIGGVLTIAVADALSDAFGVHISEESDPNTPHSEVWEATIATFLSKLFFASTFIVPILLFSSILTAIWVGIGWGFLLLGAISFWMAKDKKESPLSVIGEHWLIGFVVVVASYLVGLMINHFFGNLS